MFSFHSLPHVDFYPRPPGGGRRSRCASVGQRVIISIHALRVEGDGDVMEIVGKHLRISIHALRVEGDVPDRKFPSSPFYFYPRPPGGGRRYFEAVRRRKTVISIHALRVEGDVIYALEDGYEVAFLSTPSGWRATLIRSAIYSPLRKISIHALRVEGDKSRLRSRYWTG